MQSTGAGVVHTARFRWPGAGVVPTDSGPLHAALLRDGYALVFLQALHDGADPNARDETSQTPLMSICFWAHGRDGLRCLEQLVDAKADVALCDRSGDTALHMAAGQTEPPNMVSDDEDDVPQDQPPPQHAYTNGLIEALLDRNADVHAENKSGQTPLWSACSVPAPARVRLLLDRKANPQHRAQGVALVDMVAKLERSDDVASVLNMLLGAPAAPWPFASALI